MLISLLNYMTTHNILKSLLILLLINFSAVTFAQKNPPEQPITIKNFLDSIENDNYVIQSRRLNVENAKQSELLAGNRPNPSITLSQGTYNITNPHNFGPPSSAITYNHTFEGWNKRDARINYAKAETNRNQIDLSANIKTIQLEAYMNYIDALRVKTQLELRRKAMSNLKKDRVASANLTKDLEINEADYRFYLESIRSYFPEDKRELLTPTGQFKIGTLPSVEKFINNDFSNRNDIKSLNAALESAQKNLALVSNNRRLDLTGSVTYAHTSGWQSTDGTDNPMQNSWTASLTVPLPFSWTNNADVQIASNTISQLELAIKDAKAKAAAENRQAALRYQAALRELTEKSRAISKKSPNLITNVKELENALLVTELESNVLKNLAVLLNTIGESPFTEF